MPTLPTNQAMPAELLAPAAADAGLGVSFDPRNQIIPLITLLQANSPQCDRRGASFIENAQPGWYWLRTSLDPIRESLMLSVCCIVDEWTAWQPNRQGLIGVYAQMPADAEMRVGGEGRRRSWVRPSDNAIIEETKSVYLIIDGQPHMMPCTSTKITAVRELNTAFLQHRHPTTGDTLPAFARRYKLISAPRSNTMGGWHVPKFIDAGWATLEQYGTAKALFDVIARGSQRVEMLAEEAAAPRLQSVPPAA